MLAVKERIRAKNKMRNASVAAVNLRNSLPGSSPRKTGPPYKTSLCRQWREKGYCQYGTVCPFAHGQAELRQVTVSESEQYKNWDTMEQLVDMVGLVREEVAMEERLQCPVAQSCGKLEVYRDKKRLAQPEQENSSFDGGLKLVDGGRKSSIDLYSRVERLEVCKDCECQWGHTAHTHSKEVLQTVPVRPGGYQAVSCGHIAPSPGLNSQLALLMGKYSDLIDSDRLVDLVITVSCIMSSSRVLMLEKVWREYKQSWPCPSLVLRVKLSFHLRRLLQGVEGFTWEEMSMICRRLTLNWKEVREVVSEEELQKTITMYQQRRQVRDKHLTKLSVMMRQMAKLVRRVNSGGGVGSVPDLEGCLGDCTSFLEGELWEECGSHLEQMVRWALDSMEQLVDMVGLVWEEVGMEESLLCPMTQFCGQWSVNRDKKPTRVEESVSVDFGLVELVGGGGNSSRDLYGRGERPEEGGQNLSTVCVADTDSQALHPVRQEDSGELRYANDKLGSSSVKLSISSAQPNNSSIKLSDSNDQLSDSSAKLSVNTARLNDSHAKLSKSSVKPSFSFVNFCESSAKLSHSSAKLSHSSAKLSQISAKISQSSAKLRYSIASAGAWVDSENTSSIPEPYDGIHVTTACTAATVLSSSAATPSLSPDMDCLVSHHPSLSGDKECQPLACSTPVRSMSRSLAACQSEVCDKLETDEDKLTNTEFEPDLLGTRELLSLIENFTGEMASPRLMQELAKLDLGTGFVRWQCFERRLEEDPMIVFR